VVQKWLREQPKNFFFEGMKKLVERYCIIVQGDYVEKQHVHLFFIYGIKVVIWKLPLLSDSPLYFSMEL
jgi:hypothetical protein